MTKLEALKELKASVEAGKPILRGPLYNHFSAEIVLSFCNAYRGDHNAAFALMRECLGDRWTISTNENELQDGARYSVATLFNSGDKAIEVENAELPIAILLAVIDALMWEAEQ